MQRLIIQIAIISCASVISKAYSQKTLIIEIIEKENHIEVIAKNDWHNQSFIIDDSDKLFSTCIDVDYIVSRRDKGNLEIINRLNSKINYLSHLDQIHKVDLQKGFIVCDLTADPENACGDIHKKINSEFHYVTDLNIDIIRDAQNMDFILMSLHGNINIKSCDGYISVNHEKLIPSMFSQKNLKLIYFDSCHLGKGKSFVDKFNELNAEYYIGPIISNEAGNSSTKTILAFFKYLENNDPLESLMKTKKELVSYSNNNVLVELWYAAPFRLFKMN
jgi:hypothetical protein